MKCYLQTLLLAVLSAASLVACGGGDDNPDPHQCYVEGKPMPPRACR